MKNSNLSITVLYRFFSSAVIPVEDKTDSASSDAVEKSVYLLNIVGICQTRCDVELFITSAPAWPVVLGSEVERVQRFQLELGQLLLHDPTAATT